MASKTERPLSAEEQKFIRFYAKPEVRDLEKAAKLAGLKPRRGAELYKRPAVREEIDFRLGLLKQEQARLDAEAEILPVSLLERALAETIKIDAKEHGSTKLQALTLGFVIKGMIETRNAKAVGVQGGQSGFRPQIYGSVGTVAPQAQPGTTTLRRTEEVIHAPAAAPALPAHVFEVVER